jgi:hypothetical protein
VVVRQGAPVVGVPGSSYLPEGGWQGNLGFRFLYSDRHFVGTDEQEQREEEGSQVKNTVYTFDLGLTYGLSERNSVSISLPFQIADRSQRINGLEGERNVTTARGIGDLIVTARRWMVDPSGDPSGNYQLGFGLKFPTGQPNASDTFKFVDENGDPAREQRTVDQSIQPGDGGFGFTVDLNAFQRFNDDLATYVNGVYLFNPMETNGVDTFRGRDTESIMSIPDSYLARLGLQWAPVERFTIGLGGRMEGVPTRDVIGGSDGFRRPGYAISVEPSIAYWTGKSVFSIAVPIAVERNRTRSVSDEELGRHGDAAFADWILLVGWSFRL